MMIDAVIILFILPPIVRPVMQARGYMARWWLVVAASIFLFIKHGVIWSYYVTYALLAELLNFANEPDSFLSTQMVAKCSLIIGLISLGTLSRCLAKSGKQTTPPLPPGPLASS